MNLKPQNLDEEQDFKLMNKLRFDTKNLYLIIWLRSLKGFQCLKNTRRYTVEHSLFSIFTIAIGLSLDAFGTAVCIGLNNQVRRNNKYLFALSFGFFQFFFSLVGGYAGFWFNTRIAAVPETIGGIVIAVVGVMMIKEGFENKGECPLIKPSMYIILGMSVSIDAMVVGFTALHDVTNIFTMLEYTMFIGLITLIMSIGAFFLSRYLKKINAIGKYADYLGGIILILFGLKMIFL